MIKKIHSIGKTKRFDMLKNIKTIFPSYTMHVIRMPTKSGGLKEAKLDLETIIPISKEVAGKLKYFLVPATESVNLAKADNMIAPLSRFSDSCIEIQNSYKVDPDDWEHEEFKRELNPLINILKIKKKQ